MERFQNLVAKHHPTEKIISIAAPFSREIIAECEGADEAMVDQALSVAYDCFRNRSEWLSITERIKILENLSQILSGKIDFLAVEAAREGGKPLVDSRAEVVRGIDGIRICIETLRTNAGSVIPMRYNQSSQHRFALTQREPIGVVVAVSAFNHPFNLIVHQVAAAVASGCPVIVKPATSTPLSCLRFINYLYEAGLPETWAQAMVIEENELAERLVTDQRVAFFSFIGSAKVGWMLRSKLAPGTRCALEHGGVAPVIVSHDADIEQALPILTKGGFYHAGQVCVSVQRIFVDELIAEEFAEGLSERVQRLVVGDPTLEATEVGPLIETNEVTRVKSWVDEALELGARAMAGGYAISNTCYACTVLYDPSNDATISQNEVFGPVVCIYPYSNMDQAIKHANSLPFAFQAAVFTKDIDTAMHAYQQLDASAVMVNESTTFRVDGMPFAGLRQSGLGVGGIPHTMHDMQIEKMLVLQSKSLK